MSVVGLMLLPILGGLYGGDLLSPHGDWTPLRALGAWRNECAARKTLRLLHEVAYFARDQAEDLAP